MPVDRFQSAPWLLWLCWRPQQTELVSFWICKNHPSLVALPDVDTLGSEREQPAKFIILLAGHRA